MKAERASRNRRFIYMIATAVVALAGAVWLDTAEYWKAKAHYDDISDPLPPDLQIDLSLIEACNARFTAERESELQSCLINVWPKIRTLTGIYILSFQTRDSIVRHPEGKDEILHAAHIGIDRARELVVSPPSEVEAAAVRLLEASTNSFFIRAFSPRYLRRQWSNPQQYAWLLRTQVFFSAEQNVASASK